MVFLKDSVRGGSLRPKIRCFSNVHVLAVFGEALIKGAQPPAFSASAKVHTYSAQAHPKVPRSPALKLALPSCTENPLAQKILGGLGYSG